MAWEARSEAEQVVKTAEAEAATALVRLLDEKLAVGDVVRLTGGPGDGTSAASAQAGGGDVRPRIGPPAGVGGRGVVMTSPADPFDGVPDAELQRRLIDAGDRRLARLSRTAAQEARRDQPS